MYTVCVSADKKFPKDDGTVRQRNFIVTARCQSEFQAVEVRAMQRMFPWSQDWGPKFGGCSVFRKERGLVFVIKIGRNSWAQKHACKGGIVLAGHTHSDTAGGV